MDSVLSVVQSPIFIGTLLILGIASLVRIIVSRDPALKRSYAEDRRAPNGKMPEMPFYDSEGVKVTEDRRVLADRRRHRQLAMQDKINQDGIPG